jgi:PAS domain S-box-containing protein
MTKADIMIVDDEFVIQNDLKIIIEEMGHRVITMASKADEAIKKAEEQNPSIILMDIQLAGEMDGIEAAIVIKERFNIPVIFITAFADEIKVGRAKLTHPYGYLIKPVLERDLKVTIEMALYAAKVETERKQAEVLYLKSEEKFRSLVETSSDWIWEVDQNAVYTYVSPKVKDLLGYEPEEIVGKTPFDFMAPDEADRVVELFKKIVETKEPFQNLENINQHKEGRSVTLETSGVPVFDADRNFMGFRGIDRDISERKETEIALRKLSTAVEQSPISIIITDQSGIIEYANSEFQTLTGYRQEESVGQYPSILKSGEQSDQFYKDLWDTIKVGEVWQGTIKNKKKNGDFYWESAVIAPIKNNHDEIINFVALKKDITEQRLAEMEKEKLIVELQDALENIKTLRGLIPICANCKKIRDDEGFWNHIESYIEKHSKVQFSHGVCEECAEELYGDTKWYKKIKEKNPDSDK